MAGISGSADVVFTAAVAGSQYTQLVFSRGVVSTVVVIAVGCTGRIEATVTRDALDPDGRPNRTDGATDASKPVCLSSYLLCDDFESYTPGSSPKGPWAVYLSPSNAGQAVVETTKSTSGTHSVRLSSTIEGIGYAAVQLRTPLHLPANAYYGKMKVWASGTPTPHHWNLLQSWGYAPGTARIPSNERLYQYGGSVQIGTPMRPDGANMLSAYYLSSTVDCEQNSLATLPLRQWVCIEWQFDGPKNTMRFWIDGQPVNDLTVTDPRSGCGGTWPAPAFERLDLGWYNVSAENGVPFDMWIDDVAFDVNRVPCQ